MELLASRRSASTEQWKPRADRMITRWFSPRTIGTEGRIRAARGHRVVHQSEGEEVGVRIDHLQGVDPIGEMGIGIMTDAVVMGERGDGIEVERLEILNDTPFDSMIWKTSKKALDAIYVRSVHANRP